jgi:CRP-like cAMP-binding protein
VRFAEICGAEGHVMAIKRKASFNPKSFLAKVGEGRSIGEYRKDQIVFSQGDPADAVFYIQKGKVKVTVVSEQGKEAVVAILAANEFFGEGCLAGQVRRIATVATMTDSVVIRLEKAAIVHVIHKEPAFAEMVSFFMNKFRKLGFIHNNGGIQVYSSLLNIVLHEEPHIET